MGLFRRKQRLGGSVQVPFDSKHDNPVQRTFRKLQRRVYALKSFHRTTRYIGPVQHDLVEVPDRQVGEYRLDRVLGQGAFGKVFLGQHTTDPNQQQQVAVKAVNKRFQGMEWSKQINLEVRILSHHSQSHPGIVELMDVMHSSDKVYLVMEQADLDLHNAFFNTKLPGSQPDFFEQVIIGILEPINYLHQCGVAHGDLHPGNVLIKRNSEENTLESSDIRLCDFGLSKLSAHYNNGKRLAEHQSAVMFSHPLGCKDYRAPEQWSGAPYDARLFDVWCIGCMLLELTLGFPDGWEVTQMSERSSLQATESYLGALREHEKRTTKEGDRLFLDFLANHLLVMDPFQRATAAEALQHPFLSYSTTTGTGFWSCN